MAQIAMRNLVADLVQLQGPCLLVAVSVEDEREAIPEAQPGIVLVVHVPRPAVPPLRVRLPEARSRPGRHRRCPLPTDPRPARNTPAR